MGELPKTKENPKKIVREPAVADMFYPGDPGTLKRMIAGYLSNAKTEEIDGVPLAFMMPHAGYSYSGPIAAYGYKLLEGKKYETVIVIGPSHRAYFEGASVIPEGYYRTPLGDLEIDSKLVAAIMNENPQSIKYVKQAEAQEHSVEVQMPFLQSVLSDFKVVPIVVGSPTIESCQALAAAIGKHFDPSKHLIIASSDMSHDHPYNEAVKMDTAALGYIEKMDLSSLVKVLSKRDSELCGQGPVVATMILMKSLDAHAKVLKYANSGDIVGDKTSRIVGYGCAVFFKNAAEDACETEFDISDEQKIKLLKMARITLEEYINNKKTPEFKETDPFFEEKYGMFVTLKLKDRLQGCIGHVFPQMSLQEAVVDLTICSATRDYRFTPVTKDDLKDIRIEISILSPLEECKDRSKIVMGKHGVYVKRGGCAGIFLPQVADETGWDVETFMAHLCRDKAGLPPDAWKEKKTEVYVYTVVKFAEKP